MLPPKMFAVFSSKLPDQELTDFVKCEDQYFFVYLFFVCFKTKNSVINEFTIR